MSAEIAPSTNKPHKIPNKSTTTEENKRIIKTNETYSISDHSFYSNLAATSLVMQSTDLGGLQNFSYFYKWEIYLIPYSCMLSTIYYTDYKINIIHSSRRPHCKKN